MAVPVFLASSHYYDSVADVDDVQDIIDALGTILKTNNSPAWTEPSAGTFQSPVDDLGRYFRVAVSRVDIDTLQCVTTDQYGTTIATRRLDIEASGSPAVEVKIYSGQYHLWIDAMRATPENFRAGILDLSPQTQDAWSTSVYCCGYRNNVGTITYGENRSLNISGVSNSNALVIFPISDTREGMKTDPAGNVLTFPVMVRNASSQILGRMYQVLHSSADIAYGAEVTVPIDSNLTAKFRAAGVLPFSGGQHYKFLVRAD